MTDHRGREKQARTREISDTESTNGEEFALAQTRHVSGHIPHVCAIAAVCKRASLGPLDPAADPATKVTGPDVIRACLE